MFLGKLLFVAAASIVSQEPKVSVGKTPDGKLEVTTPSGSKGGVYLVDTGYFMVVKPNEALTAAGIDASDYIVEACGKDLTSSALSNQGKADVVNLLEKPECIFKVKRRESLLYVTVKRKA